MMIQMNAAPVRLVLKAWQSAGAWHRVSISRARDAVQLKIPTRQNLIEREKPTYKRWRRRPKSVKPHPSTPEQPCADPSSGAGCWYGSASRSSQRSKCPQCSARAKLKSRRRPCRIRWRWRRTSRASTRPAPPPRRRRSTCRRRPWSTRRRAISRRRPRSSTRTSSPPR
jgi:hypothetical protein